MISDRYIVYQDSIPIKHNKGRVMDGLLGFFSVDFLHDHLPDSWFDNFHQIWGDSLTDEMVLQSVQEASDFFNMNAPMDVHEDWTTGVMTGIPFTENDDILVFNRQQMLDMGITDKEGFDLVMTHEGAHRALQGINTGFDSHQEELCCDYLAGVRAGLNGLDEGKMEASLSGTIESETHPDGAARVAAIEAGVSFAHDYMEAHNGTPPTFSECLEHFEQQYDISQNDTNGNVNLRPEQDAIHGFHGYTQEEINSYRDKASHEMSVQEGYMRHHAKLAESRAHAGQVNNFEKYQFECAKNKYEAAKAEYNKWKRMKPTE